MGKNSIFLLSGVLGLLCSLSGKAQERHHQFNAGAGMASARYFDAAGVWEERREGAGSTSVGSSGVYHFGYRYTVAGRHSFGIQLAGERQKVTKSGGTQHPEAWKQYIAWKDIYLTVLPDYRYNWGPSPGGRWYSGVAAGISRHQRKETHNDFSLEKKEYSKTGFAYQVTALGVEFGKKLGGYAELGYGYKGALSAGVKYGF